MPICVIILAKISRLYYHKNVNMARYFFEVKSKIVESQKNYKIAVFRQTIY